MKKLFLIIIVLPVLTACSVGVRTDREDPVNGEKEISLEMKFKCKDYGGIFAREFAVTNLIEEPDALVSREYGYSKVLNTCLIYLEDFKFLSAGWVTHAVYDTLTGKLLLSTIEHLPTKDMTEDDRSKLIEENEEKVRNFEKKKDMIFNPYAEVDQGELNQLLEELKQLNQEN